MWFSKRFSAQHCLLTMIEKWKKCLDNKGYCGALLTDLSKAFDCIPHNLLLAKLSAYGLDISSVTYIKDYLSHRKQKVKINNVFSNYTEILFGVPQGSILGPLLFNIFLSDLFLFLPDTDIISYADDNTPYSVGNSEDQVITDIKFQRDHKRLFILSEYVLIIFFLPPSQCNFNLLRTAS